MKRYPTPQGLKKCKFNQDTICQNCKAYYSIHCWQGSWEMGTRLLLMGVQAGTTLPEVTLAVSLLI